MNRSAKFFRSAGLLFAFGIFAALMVSIVRAADDGGAKIAVDGLGWLGNRDSRNSLKRLLGQERGPVLSANALEDAMFLLMSAVQEDGFLKPVIAVEWVDPRGVKSEVTLDSSMNVAIPRTSAAREVRLTVRRGVRYYVEDVRISGLTVVPEKTAVGFFVGESTLFSGKAARAYTPARLSRGIDSLEAELRQRGYADSKVRASEVKIDDVTGQVSLALAAVEGVPWRVAAVDVEVIDGAAENSEKVQRFVGQNWTDSVQQDLAAELRRSYLAVGFPDVRVRVTHETAPPQDGWRDVRVNALVRPGEHVTVGQVRYEGAGDVRPSVLQRRVRAQPGAVLNVIEFEQARYRLSRLGVFNRVDLSYAPGTGPIRDPVFTLRPGRRAEVNLLAGFGTYEQLRAGIEARQYNVFGLAHQTRGFLVQSMKSTRGEYSYTVPEIFGESIDGTAKLFGLRREEVAFEREEYGGTFAFSAPIVRLGVNATAGYTFQALRNRDNQLVTQSVDDKQVIVASVDVGLTRDRRDNPLLPRRGYRVFGQVEAASRKLGGEAEYQRFEFGGSYHTGWGSGRWFHFSAAHGVITTWGESDESLPVNKRFYPGGDGSLRGYAQGEASPRGFDGKFIGAKSYMSASVEFEQALARKWTVVVFGDALGTAAQLKYYPFAETLFSAGTGLRYQTLIGPIRAEYGRTLKRRVGDPSGAWLFSIGFPF